MDSSATVMGQHASHSDHGHRHHVPEARHVHHRYFENPFPEYSAGASSRRPDEYLEQVANLLQNIDRHYRDQKLDQKKADIYTGTAGIAYACHRLIAAKGITQQTQQLAVDVADRCLGSALRHGAKEQGFLTGDSGVLVVSALYYKDIGDAKKAEECIHEYVKICADVHRMKVGDSTGDEIFSGRVGYLTGLLELSKAFSNDRALGRVDVTKIVEAIVNSGRQYSKEKRLEKECPLYFYHYGSDYMGAAHGISAILQILLSFPEALSTVQGAEHDVRKSIDFVVSQQMSNGNFPAQFGETDREDLLHWCHGAPGVIYMLAKAYLYFNDKTYLEACGRCSDIIWRKGLLRKGPGLCHGISGNGYAFLLMYRVTGNEEFLYRAQCFADFQFQPSVLEKSRTPDHPFSLFEGVAGSLCFLADLLHPSAAVFPFFDVFFDFKSTGQ